MTTVAKSSNDLLKGYTAILAAATGSQPTELLGYASNSMKVKVTRKFNDFFVEDLPGVFEIDISEVGVEVSGELAQVHEDVLARCLGETKTGYEVNLGAAMPEVEELAIRVIGATKNRRPFHIYLPRALSISDLDFEMSSKKGPSVIPVTFRAIDGTAGLAKFMWGRPAVAATIATGTFGRTQVATGATINGISFCTVSGEGAAADTLTDITALAGTAALTNNEILRLQIAAITMPITITHASGIIEMTDAASLTLSKISDWIDFYYDLPNTTWKELTRYVAP